MGLKFNSIHFPLVFYLIKFACVKMCVCMCGCVCVFFFHIFRLLFVLVAGGNQSRAQHPEIIKKSGAFGTEVFLIN